MQPNNEILFRGKAPRGPAPWSPGAKDIAQKTNARTASVLTFKQWEPRCTPGSRIGTSRQTSDLSPTNIPGNDTCPSPSKNGKTLRHGHSLPPSAHLVLSMCPLSLWPGEKSDTGLRERQKRALDKLEACCSVGNRAQETELGLPQRKGTRAERMSAWLRMSRAQGLRLVGLVPGSESVDATHTQGNVPLPLAICPQI